MVYLNKNKCWNYTREGLSILCAMLYSWDLNLAGDFSFDATPWAGALFCVMLCTAGLKILFIQIPMPTKQAVLNCNLTDTECGFEAGRVAPASSSQTISSFK